ncbi:MarR family winged helix-turn-helix transcriptional regulator [Sphingomonas oryzagri]|jgi:DNA-binding MarR family transcriptional regulator|uniref:MarR family transcriptional regulator n=1 Tax=Sphingomonas oryzagri TaxID=3042314 RepID=A0ABT6MYJ4_9SPHN|nr:MarR family transcriptional regulator [Sphingomonas oryzagri]MDH7638130.1 MarR family transcriptional regulator [Sphingomonas oryzagri]
MDEDLSDAHYEALASIRHELRRFLHFSEQAASSSGVTPQQHQALLAIRASGGAMLVGELAERLLLKPHSASEHVDRLVKLGLVRRRTGTSDKRQVPIELTTEGSALLASLSRVHREELRRIRPLLTQLIGTL